VRQRGDALFSDCHSQFERADIGIGVEKVDQPLRQCALQLRRQCLEILGFGGAMRDFDEQIGRRTGSAPWAPNPAQVRNVGR
jgi:hypothetical protein